jgi:hypothetical protein
LAAGSILLGPVLCHADGIPLRLHAGTFDPLYDGVQLKSAISSSLSSVSTDTRYYIVQCQGPILQQWRTEIESNGAVVLSYIPDFAYLVRVKDSSMAKSLCKLSFVRWVGPYLPAYKIADELLDTNGEVDVSILLHPGENDAGSMAIVKDSLEKVEKGGSREIIHATIGRDALLQLAQRDEVSQIQIHRTVHKLNNVARGIMDVNTAWQDVGLYGANQIVGICDTGLDTGNTSTLLADFQGRVVAAFALGRTNDWSDNDHYPTSNPIYSGAEFVFGHGTHVAGSFVGSGVLSGSTPSTHSYTSSFAGVAPEASLVFQSAADTHGNLVGVPDDLSTLFQQAYNAGARVHSDSWGSSTQSIYDDMSESTDSFCWNNKDMVICYPAGNDGVDSNNDGVVDLYSLDTPSTAKDSICVGASETLRSTGGYASDNYSIFGFTTPPISTDLIANNSSGMAAWSSRGPTSDGRIKPDVVAPGTDNISCRSQLATAPLGDWCYGAYNQYYVYLGGTSMSTPLVAGACTLIREYFMEKRGVTDPSSALVKAALINGTFDMYPGQYGTGAYLEVPKRPNPVEGWGRVDVANSMGLISGRGVGFVDNATGLSTNGSATYKYAVGNALPVHVTLVWTDYPASTSASVDLVNDLDLTVTDPNGTVYLGNGGDHVNNVEGVDIASPVAGTYTIKVSGYNVPDGPQPFALVISGELGSIQGTVADAAGFGVSGATVTATVSGGSTTYSGTTDTSGAYSISVPSGTYVVAASSSGLAFTPSSSTVTVANNPVTGVSFTLAGSLSVTFVSPTSAYSYQAASSALNIAGRYTGNPTSITWQNNRAGSGSCSVTSYYQWNYSGIPLQPGMNIITVTATDGSGNTANAYMNVFYSTASSQILAAGVASDQTVWYTTNLNSWTRIPGLLTSVVMGDFNADGVYDVAGVASDYTVWYSTDKSTWTQIPGHLATVVAGNFDGSGHDSLAGLGADGSVWYSTDLKSWKNIPGYLTAITAGDFAGSGKDGLAGLASDGSIWYTADLVNWKNIPGRLSKLTVGDLNGDGVDDIAGIASDGTVWYTTDLNDWTEIPGILATISVGDFGGNGIDQIVGTTSGNMIFRSTDLQSWSAVPGLLKTVLATDLNSDGKDDIIGLASDGSIWYTTDLSTWHFIPGILSQLCVKPR